jgi:hypothetical protein
MVADRAAPSQHESRRARRPCRRARTTADRLVLLETCHRTSGAAEDNYPAVAQVAKSSRVKRQVARAEVVAKNGRRQ